MTLAVLHRKYNRRKPSGLEAQTQGETKIIVHIWVTIVTNI